jgi:vacuolar-type H+-ATPase subunit H
LRSVNATQLPRPRYWPNRKAGKTVTPIVDEGTFNDAAEVAIARVLGAERAARESVERARVEADQIAEGARLAARTLAERTERRIRAVVGAFERELAERLAEIDAQAVGLGTAQPLTGDDNAAVQRAVEALARELVGLRQ